MSNNLGRQRERLAVTALLLAAVLLGMGLRLYELDCDSLWLDEIRTALRVRPNLEALLANLARGQGGDQAPLSYVVTKIFVVLAGDSEFVLRLQAALFGTLAILLAYDLGKGLWGSKEALIGALLLAVHPYHVQYSQEARHYALMVFLALLSLVLLVKALKKNGLWFWLGFALCTSLSLYNHYFSLLFLPAAVVFAAWSIAETWLSRAKKNDLSSYGHRNGGTVAPASQAVMLLASLTLIAASFLPWWRLPAFREMIATRVGPDAATASSSSLAFSLIFMQEVLGAYIGYAGGVLVLCLALIVLGLLTSGPRRAALAFLWAATPFAVLAVVRPEHFVHPRYLLYTLPLYVLVIGRGIVGSCAFLGRWPKTMRLNTTQVLLATSLVAILFALTAVVPLRSYYLSQKEDWRGAALYLTANMTPSDVVLATWERTNLCISFYLERYGLASERILRARRGVARSLARNPWHLSGHVWTVVSARSKASLEDLPDELVETGFHEVSLVRARQPHPDLVTGTESMILLELGWPATPEEQSDKHVGLADIYLRTGRFDQAQSHLALADQLRPAGDSTRHQDRTYAELEQFTAAVAGPQPHSVWRSLGLQMALLGYDLTPSTSQVGRGLHVTIWWQSLLRMTTDYTAFVHLLGPDERIWGQQDRLLMEGDDPTSSWLVGQVLKEEYELELAQDVPAGEYRLITGVYDWRTRQRLLVWDQTGAAGVEDTVALASVTITE